MMTLSCWCVSFMPSLLPNFFKFPSLILPQCLCASSFCSLFHLEHWHGLPISVVLCFTGGVLTLPPGPAITQNFSPIVSFWFLSDVPRPQPPSSSHYVHINLLFVLLSCFASGVTLASPVVPQTSSLWTSLCEGSLSSSLLVIPYHLSSSKQDLWSHFLGFELFLNTWKHYIHISVHETISSGLHYVVKRDYGVIIFLCLFAISFVCVWLHVYIL